MIMDVFRTIIFKRQVTDIVDNGFEIINGKYGHK